MGPLVESGWAGFLVNDEYGRVEFAGATTGVGLMGGG